MERIITFETLRFFAYSNHERCKKPFRGAVLYFPGLGTKDMIKEDPEPALRYAEEGILYIIPYYNPWCWMNPQAVAYVDEILDVLFRQYDLPEDFPIAATGQSMGGLCALVYTAKAKRTPKACVANCPVCDLPYHFTERPDLPRTLYSAFGTEEGTLEEILKAHSPLHLAMEKTLPKSDYHVFHCTEDRSVNMERHSDRLISVMKQSYKVTYYPVLDQGHCKLTPEAWEKYYALPEDVILNRK